MSSKIKIKCIYAGYYKSDNGWTISQDNDWAALWRVYPSKLPREGYVWKGRTFVSFKTAKNWVMERPTKEEK